MPLLAKLLILLVFLLFPLKEASALSSMCPIAKIINKTNEWLPIDEENFKIAINRCKVLFPEAPCLKTFVKKEKLVYNVICTQRLKMYTLKK